METNNKKIETNLKRKMRLLMVVFMISILIQVSVSTDQAYYINQHPPYLTVGFSYCDALHDSDHNNSMSEDEIYAMYDYIIASEYTWSALQNDDNKGKTFLYLDIYGKDSNTNNPAHVFPAPDYFITEHFPSGHGNIPSNQKEDGSPYAYIMTDDYLEDLLVMIEEFYSELDSHGITFGGFFLDDWYNAPNAWNDSMTPADRDIAWPGRGHTDAEQNDWWMNSQYPRMIQFEADLHTLTVQYFGTSTLIVNGPSRNFRTLPNGLKEPYYYGNLSYTPDKTTIRCFEGPTVSTNNYANFPEMILDPSDEDYKYWRAFFPKDLLLMYSVEGNVNGHNGGYGDWIDEPPYDGNVDWVFGTNLVFNHYPDAMIALAYGSTPATGGSWLSLFTNPLEWPYSRQEIPDTAPPDMSDESPIGTITNTLPQISAELSDDESGIDATRVYIKVDGINRTSNATITSTRISYIPSSALSYSTHIVNITASDNDSNTGYLEWSFIVQSSSDGGNDGIGEDEENDTNESEHISPLADAGGPYVGYVNQSILFSGSGSNDSDGHITNYSWDFGDNTTGWGMTPTHVYSQSGTYLVNLTVMDNDSLFDSNVTTVIIRDFEENNIPPTADAGGPYLGVVNTTITFNGSGSTDLDGNLRNISWDFGDNSSGYGISPTHKYSNVGTYTIMLTVTDNDGAVHHDSTTVIITLTEKPTPGFELILLIFSLIFFVLWKRNNLMRE